MSQNLCLPPDLIRLPNVVILDTVKPASIFINTIESLPHLLSDSDRIIMLILQSLTYEKDAELNLAYNVMDEISQHTDDVFHDEAIIAANATVRFGSILYDQFRALSMYRHGYLFYQFHQWLGSDLVLRKLTL